MDKKGNLYGTTLGGGIQSNFCGVGCGTVFELSPTGKNSWTETVIYSFQGNGNDTTNPWANVIADGAGNLYGTATLGGNYNDCESGGCGAVFELSPGNGGVWTENIIYTFTSGKDGDTPYAGLARDADGNLYGTNFQANGPRIAAFTRLRKRLQDNARRCILRSSYLQGRSQRRGQFVCESDSRCQGQSLRHIASRRR